MAWSKSGRELPTPRRPAGASRRIARLRRETLDCGAFVKHKEITSATRCSDAHCKNFSKRPMNGFHVGLDLDNTIITYDAAFARVGAEIGLLATGHGLCTKDEVKSFLIKPDRGEQDWMRLQGQVYGRHIGSAALNQGVREFIGKMRRRGAHISIISHKTRFGHFDDEINLWDAARGWLDRQSFFSPDGLGLNPADLHFLETRDEKVSMIEKAGCDAFVDDLPEVLADPAFPRRTVGIWFAGERPAADGAGLLPYRNWADIGKKITTLMASR